jgi:hypothetical protein
VNQEEGKSKQKKERRCQEKQKKGDMFKRGENGGRGKDTFL